jgi:hypothetical protein
MAPIEILPLKLYPVSLTRGLDTTKHDRPRPITMVHGDDDNDGQDE